MSPDEQVACAERKLRNAELLGTQVEHRALRTERFSAQVEQNNACVKQRAALVERRIICVERPCADAAQQRPQDLQTPSCAAQHPRCVVRKGALDVHQVVWNVWPCAHPCCGTLPVQKATSWYVMTAPKEGKGSPKHDLCKPRPAREARFTPPYSLDGCGLW